MFRRVASLIFLVVLAACGGSSNSNVSQPTAATPPPTPAVSISAAGEGNLVLHPSATSVYTFTLETPIRVRETSGGTADWNFARFSVFRAGREIERGEVGADSIRAAGYSRITANSSNLYRVYFRFNSDNFDDLRVTLGFGDLKDSRQFTVDVVDNWSDVTISMTPAALPAGAVGR